MPRLLTRAALTTLAIAAVAPQAAKAATWASLSSGTTETINALDYRGAGAYWYGTSTGKLFKNGAQATGTTGGQPINDLAMSADGTTGLAVGSGGKIMRSTDGGATWAAVAGGSITSYPDTNCAGANGGAGSVTENLVGVAWANATTAYIVGPANSGTARSPLLKTTDSGSTWTDINRSASGSCLIGSAGQLTDVVALPGTSTVWFVAQSFGARWVSFDDGGTVTSKPSTSVNHFTGSPRIAVSTEQPDWLYVVDREDDSSSLNFYSSTDTGNTFTRVDHPNGDNNVPALYGVAAIGQTMLAAGNAGAIYLTTDARNAYKVSDTGPFATTNWRTVSMVSASSAAVAGQGGVIATTTNANVIPDLVAPSGSINDPGTVTELTPKAFTATLTDNAGGSGIDPASITWSATTSGASPVTGSGNPVTLTFPSSGTWTVTVTFKDLAGNSATATRTVNVGKASTASRTTTTRVPGAEVRFSVPRTCVAAGSSFTVTLSWKKQKRKGNKFVKITRVDFFVAGKRVKIDRKAPFRQRLTVKAGTAPGSTVTLKARAYIKVKRGKAPKKSITNKITTCT